MTKLFIRCLALFSLICGLGIHGYGENSSVDVRGKTAAIFLVDREQFLCGKNLDEQMYPASMTKVATALYILRCHPHILQQYLTVPRDAIATISPQTKKQSFYRSPPHWLETDGVSIQLKYKEEVLGRDLFYALLLCSANDAANVLAASCGYSIPAFMEALNQFLKTIGCHHTHFNNPHGLHHPNHFTTTRDLILIMKEALKEPFFLQIIQTTSYTIPATNLHDARLLSTTNKLILPESTYHYAPCIGGKTGTTKSAGKNIIIAAEKHNRPIIVTATGYQGGSEGLYQDVIALCESVFNESLIHHVCLPPDSLYTFHLPLYGTMTIPLPQGLSCDYYASESSPPASFSLIPCVSKFPVQEGELLGSWVFRDDQGRLIAEEPAYAPSLLSLSFRQRLRAMVLRVLTSVSTYVIIILICVYTRVRRPRRTRRTSRYHF